MTHRSAIAVLILVLCCLLSSARLVIDASRPRSVKNLAQQIPSRSDQRFATLKAALPAHGAVGYVGEAGAPVDVLSDYYLTQYALAPLVVEDSTNHPLVIGNFPRSQRSQVPDNLKMIQDFGNGVFL